MKNRRGYLRFRYLVCGIALSTIVVASIGCGPEPKVEIHRVPKQHVLDKRHGIERERPHLQLPSSQPPISQRPTTVFAAIVPHGEKVWFFTMKGAQELVLPRETDFRSLVDSIHFDAENESPQWQTPEGWRQEAGDFVREAILVHGSGTQKVELAISPFPRKEGDYQAYVLSNVNRWLRQDLGLPSIDQEDLSPISEQLALPDGIEATLVILHSTSPALAPPSAAPEITYDLPDGWTQKVPSSSIVREAFTVSQEDLSVEITVTALTVRGGALLPNVNRWRGKLNLDPIAVEDLPGSIQELEIGDLTVPYVQLTGKNDEGNPDTILAVILFAADRAWCLRLRGDPELARQEQTNFEAFARSFRVGEAEE